MSLFLSIHHLSIYVFLMLHHLIHLMFALINFNCCTQICWITYLSVWIVCPQTDSWRQGNVAFNDQLLCVCACVHGAMVAKHSLATTPVWSSVYCWVVGGRKSHASLTTLDSHTHTVTTHFSLHMDSSVKLTACTEWHFLVLPNLSHSICVCACVCRSDRSTKADSLVPSVCLFYEGNTNINMSQRRRWDDSAAAFPNDDRWKKVLLSVRKSFLHFFPLLSRREREHARLKPDRVKPGVC